MTRPAAEARTTRLAPSWHPHQITDTRAWTVELSSAHIAEIDRARYDVRRAWQPLLGVRREDFPLPTLGPELARIARRLDRSPGFFVVRGVPTGYSEEDLRLVYWGLGRHLGVAVPQDAEGRLLRPADTGSAAFHSGGSDVVSLLAVSGGRTAGLVSAGAVHNEVAARRPELASRMFGRFAFDRWGEHEPGERPFRILPMACWSADRYSFRYERAAIEQASRHQGAPELTLADRDLLDLVDELLPDLRHDVHLGRGDMLLVNNHEVLLQHDGAVPAPLPDPTLLRLWLTLRGGRDLPESYVWATPAYGADQGRGGVTPCDRIDRSRWSRRKSALC